jgi:hypothetical protein
MPVLISVKTFPRRSNSVTAKKERAPWNKGGYLLWHDISLTQLLKAGCASLSRPTASAGDSGDAFEPIPGASEKCDYCL